MKTTAVEKVSDYWGVDRRGARSVSWAEHPILLENLHRHVTGSPNKGTYVYWQEKYLCPPVSLALSLGCGFGAFERAFVDLGAVRHFHAFDISENAIESARKEARAANLENRIDYRVVDLDRVELPANTYDAIFAISSIHHVYALENYFQQCRQALKPGGLLFLDEYIGPSRIQCPPFVVRIINQIRDILPDKYRRNALIEGRLAYPYQNTPIEHFEAHDPSEAIRSAEIVNTLKLYFDLVEVRPYGGAILHMLLSGLSGNFDENNPVDVALLRLMALLEESLEESGAIQFDFAAIVACPK